MLSGFTRCYSGATIEHDAYESKDLKEMAAHRVEGNALLHEMEEQVEKIFDATST